MAEVLVLGAGVSGLAAAAALTDAGVEVCVVEARSRIGGRIFTLRDDRTPLPVELGAEFLHGESASTHAIVRRSRLALVDVVGTHYRAQRGQRLKPMRGFGEKLGRVLEVAARRVAHGPDRSFSEAISGARLPADARQVATAYVEGFNAAFADRISARSLGGGGADERTARVIAGYDRVASWLASRIPNESLRLGTIATGVEWSPKGVSVECKSAAGGVLPTLRARHLVLTLPLSLLHAVQFEPALESKAHAMSKLAMGDVLRFTMRFRDAFWTKFESLSFIHAPGAPITTFWTTYPIQTPLLTAWAGGPAASVLLPLGEEHILDRAMQSLAPVFRMRRRDVESRLEACFFHDWSTDPFSRGAYSYPLVGGARAAKTLAAAVQNTLFFAGEATALPPNNGTVHGAIASGERAAREILVARR